jgi:hypothetical protein
MINRLPLKICAWSGIVGVVIIGLGMFWAGLLPIPGPSESARQTYDHLVGQSTSVRLGLILAMMGSGLLVGYAATLFVQMRRIEGEHAVLSHFQMGSGVLLSLEFIYLIFFWQTATFRVDRAPELVQLLNDMAWIPFVGLSSTLILQALCFGVVVLMDKREQPIFPRWVGWFSIFSALSFTPGSINMFFMHGPFAWNGIIAIYFPVTVYVFWNLFNCIFAAKAVDGMNN